MLRFLVLLACLAAPVFGNSAGAPQAICSNGLVPEHHVDPQSSRVPYSFSGGDAVKAGDAITIKLSGDGFLGFAVQVQDAKEKPIGSFKIVESKYSQTLSCSNPGDTLTHKKIDRRSPLKSVEFQWIAPADYKGKADVVGTVAKDGGTYWVRQVHKNLDVE